jgi:hypothetical protein
MSVSGGTTMSVAATTSYLVGMCIAPACHQVVGTTAYTAYGYPTGPDVYVNNGSGYESGYVQVTEVAKPAP